MAEGLTINAGPLFNRAKAAYGRTLGAGSDREPHYMDALDAIVFSVVSLEAFMNELAALASQPPFRPEPPEPDSIKTFADLVFEAEAQHKPLDHKFTLASTAFTGEDYNKGAQPYQDFDNLMDLRNAIVHFKPLDQLTRNEEGFWVFSPPPVVRRLESRNVTAEFANNTSAAWILHLSTRAVARWSCNTASEMVQSVLSMVPESQFCETLKLFYAEPFKPI